jgi:hypothetical protein
MCVCVFFPFSMLQLTLMAQVLSLQAPITMKVAAVAKFKVRVLAVQGFGSGCLCGLWRVFERNAN